ncbi:MAG: rRNA maturation RNase YbeY [Flavobacteriaceae bacterium]|nr:rRNA maturation RNase YbeY [Flavobacteriaceae bacterium]
MINFNFEFPAELRDEGAIKSWLQASVQEEGFKINNLEVIFCSDDFLYGINRDYLGHDDYTDVVGFDYSVGKSLQGEIYISVERVKDNAEKYDVDFHAELFRVLIHGALHFCGWNDDTAEKKGAMRKQEDFYLSRLEGFN